VGKKIILLVGENYNNNRLVAAGVLSCSHEIQEQNSN